MNFTSSLLSAQPLSVLSFLMNFTCSLLSAQPLPVLSFLLNLCLFSPFCSTFACCLLLPRHIFLFIQPLPVLFFLLDLFLCYFLLILRTCSLLSALHLTCFLKSLQPFRSSLSAQPFPALPFCSIFTCSALSHRSFRPGSPLPVRLFFLPTCSVPVNHHPAPPPPPPPPLTSRHPATLLRPSPARRILGLKVGRRGRPLAHPPPLPSDRRRGGGERPISLLPRTTE
jgi:hypothetical protein